MAEKIDFEFEPSRIGKHTYPWRKWLDGDVWKISKGDDYVCMTASIKTNIQAQARKRGKKVRAKVVDDGNALIFQAVKLDKDSAGSSKSKKVPYVHKKETRITAEVKDDHKWRNEVYEFLKSKGKLEDDPMKKIGDLESDVEYLSAALEEARKLLEFHGRKWNDGRLNSSDQMRSVVDAVGDIEVTLAHICSIMDMNIDGCRNEALKKLKAWSKKAKTTSSNGSGSSVSAPRSSINDELDQMRSY